MTEDNEILAILRVRQRKHFIEYIVERLHKVKQFFLS